MSNSIVLENNSRYHTTERTQEKRILFVLNADWFFLTNRLKLAITARENGYEVIVAAPDTGMAKEIRRHGFAFMALPRSTKGFSANPFRELKVLFSLIKLYREFKPSVIHHSTPKIVIYGSLASRFVPDASVINLISGLGYNFSDRMKARVLRPFTKLLYAIALHRPKSCLVFQNSYDRRFFIKNKFVEEENTELIPGSGVNCKVFVPTNVESEEPVVMIPARLLWGKGVGEFVMAARLIRERNPKVRFVLVGKPDPGNPSSIPEPMINSWIKDGCVEWWGHQSCMPDVLASATIVVLPSYTEGLPKVLVEASATGKPIVATDIPGCRDVVRHKVNGLLVPPKDPYALAKAIWELLDSPEKRRKYGAAGRRMAVEMFDENIIAKEFTAVLKKFVA